MVNKVRESSRQAERVDEIDRQFCSCFCSCFCFCICFFACLEKTKRARVTEEVEI